MFFWYISHSILRPLPPPTSLSLRSTHPPTRPPAQPENVLLAGDGTVKIGDFGQSRFTDAGGADDELRAALGTPAFLAPEVAAGRAYRGRAADVWALGVCLYSFVYGELPFREENLADLYEAIEAAEVPFPAHVPVSMELQDLLLRALAADPARRATAEELLRHPWAAEEDLRALVPGMFEGWEAPESAGGGDPDAPSGSSPPAAAALAPAPRSSPLVSPRVEGKGKAKAAALAPAATAPARVFEPPSAADVAAAVFPSLRSARPGAGPAAPLAARGSVVGALLQAHQERRRGGGGAAAAGGGAVAGNGPSASRRALARPHSLARDSMVRPAGAPPLEDDSDDDASSMEGSRHGGGAAYAPVAAMPSIAEASGGSPACSSPREGGGSAGAGGGPPPPPSALGTSGDGASAAASLRRPPTLRATLPSPFSEAGAAGAAAPGAAAPGAAAASPPKPSGLLGRLSFRRSLDSPPLAPAPPSPPKPRPLLPADLQLVTARAGAFFGRTAGPSPFIYYLEAGTVEVRWEAAIPELAAALSAALAESGGGSSRLAPAPSIGGPLDSVALAAPRVADLARALDARAAGGGGNAVDGGRRGTLSDALAAAVERARALMANAASRGAAVDNLLVAVYGPGQYVGALAMLEPDTFEGRWQSSGTATAAVEGVRMTREGLDVFLAQNPLAQVQLRASLGASRAVIAKLDALERIAQAQARRARRAARAAGRAAAASGGAAAAERPSLGARLRGLVKELLASPTPADYM
jgi:hypothetical protein